MPWKDKSKRRAWERGYQRRWHAKKKAEDPEWFARLTARKNARNKRVRSDSSLRAIEWERQNEHNHRVREWEYAHRSKLERQAHDAGLNVVDSDRHKNPKFKVINPDGKWATEMLFEPFPVWGPKEGDTEK